MKTLRCFQGLSRLLCCRWSLRRVEGSGQPDLISAGDRQQQQLPARLPTWGWVTPSPIFNQHTCMHICINAHASIGAQAGAHIHLLHLWCRRRPLQGRSLSYIPCTCITFAAWLVLHALMFRFRERKHRLGRRKRPQNHVVLTRARVQAPTSLAQLVCHSPPFCVTQTSTRREKTLSFFY